ncbi:MAG: hypothetical protein V2I47_01925 [Bacteroidales bacterium]|jgi:hypothetical protein|nr:hypothetical protein [Bacteroidales bacterium]
MNIVSKIIGTVAFIIMLIGLLPLFGMLNYIVIPLATIGLFFGIFSRNTGGLLLNGIVLIVSLMRLIAGGGII